MHFENNRYPDVHTALSQDRVIFLAEDLTKEVASSLCGLLIYYNASDPKEDINVLIHTSGGDVSALSGIYDVMSLIDAPVSTVGIGKIYSAGALILASGTKGKRFIFKNAEVMIHGLQCSYPTPDLPDQADKNIYFDFLNNINKRIVRILAKHTGQTLSKIEQDIKRDLFLDAKSALKYGIVDKIL